LPESRDTPAIRIEPAEVSKLCRFQLSVNATDPLQITTQEKNVRVH
jgi:hypothetical protein